MSFLVGRVRTGLERAWQAQFGAGLWRTLMITCHVQLGAGAAFASRPLRILQAMSWSAASSISAHRFGTLGCLTRVRP